MQYSGGKKNLVRKEHLTYKSKQMLIHTGTNKGYDLANKSKYGATFPTLTPLLCQASLGLGHFESHHLIQSGYLRAQYYVRLVSFGGINVYLD